MGDGLMSWFDPFRRMKPATRCGNGATWRGSPLQPHVEDLAAARRLRKQAAGWVTARVAHAYLLAVPPPFKAFAISRWCCRLGKVFWAKALTSASVAPAAASWNSLIVSSCALTPKLSV